MPRYDSLSSKLQERIIEDKKNHWKNPYAFSNEDAIRRDPTHDKANLWRPAFVRDTEKIMHIPYYNRYGDKTQVFSLYKNDDISRRSQHVQIVSRIARNIGSVLGLNIDLIEAIALGHDIGHTPFGHAGERKLSEIYHRYTGKYFNHNIHSARVLDGIFPLNISLQTLDGIICHNGEMELKEYHPRPYADFETFDQKMKDCYENQTAIKKLVPATLEACVMRVSDIIAYLGKDRQDAVKLGLMKDHSAFEGGAIGATNAEVINNLIVNLIENSYGKSYLKMDEEFFEAFSRGKKENYQLIYGHEKVDSIFETDINPMFEELYDKLLCDLETGDENTIIFKHHIKYIQDNTKYYSKKNYADNDKHDIVVDFLASMTDDYFIDLYHYYFPNGNHNVKYVGYFED